MTASISSRTTASATSSSLVGLLPGFRALLRKELTEWRRARRSWIVVLVSGLFLALGAMNAWLISVLPSDMTGGEALPSMEPLGNLIGPVSTHVFVIVAVFAVIALITAERESGTLAWTASKPVSRSGIWLAKFTSATGVMWLLAGILPLAVAVAVVTILYGTVSATTIAAVAIGMGLVITLYVAVALSASTLVTSQAAVAGITLAVLSIGPMLAALLPDPLLMPTSILDWTVGLGLGTPAGFLPVVTWAATVIALVTFSVRRMERLEL